MNFENLTIYRSTGGANTTYFARLDGRYAAILILSNPRKIWITKQLQSQYPMEETSWLEFLITTGFSKQQVVDEIKRTLADSCLR